MNKNYTVTRCISANDLEYLRRVSGSVEYQPAMVESRQGPRVNPNKRVTGVYPMKAHELPEGIKEALLSTVDESHKYYVAEVHFLRYTEGGHFSVHDDGDADSNGRIYTTTTVLHKSSDLDGGDLCVYNENVRTRLPLSIGETITFKSTVYHGVDKVNKGTRYVLVCWLHAVT